MRTWAKIAAVLLLCAGVCIGSTSGAGSEPALLPADVLLLANSDDPASMRIARHYAAVRNVPPANLYALPMPAQETITWTEFVGTVWEPLMARLVKDQWIDAIPMDLVDPVGRRKYAVSGHRIAALVVCRGVPLRIAHDPALYAANLPFTVRTEFQTNRGAVDAELALLASPQHPINAFVPNPLFLNEHPTRLDQEQVVKVSRLDGPTEADAAALVDRAVAAERDGLIGRAYVDLSDRDPLGNRWLEATARQLRDLAFDVTVDRDAATMPLGARIDAPALYFGWYANDVNGAFLLPGFRFPPGAIALHIHSYSAATLRSVSSGWAGPFVARGVTATFGNVFEPYLELTQRPDLLLRSLARGACLIDAAYYSTRALSWQEIVIGDPLYRPFAVTFDEQCGRSDRLPDELSPYVVLRRAAALDLAGKARDAEELLAAEQRRRPSLAVGVALARRRRDDHRPGAAVEALRPVVGGRAYSPDQWALAREAALLLLECGQPALAEQVWRPLLAQSSLPSALRAQWLPDAAAASKATGQGGSAAEGAREPGRMESGGR